MSKSTKVNVLVLTLLLSLWLKVRGTTVQISDGGTDSVPCNNTSLDPSINQLSARTHSASLYSTNQSTEPSITRTTRVKKEHSPIGAVLIDRSSIVGSFSAQRRGTKRNAIASRNVSLPGDKEVVIGKYYRQDGTTESGSTNKGRRSFKQTHSDRSDLGGTSDNTLANSSIEHHPPPTTNLNETILNHNEQLIDTTNKRRQFDASPNRGKNKEKTDLMSKLLPMMIMPFLISTSFIPMMLTSLKFMLLKSMLVGKVAIVLLVLNALWRIDNKGGVYSHNVEGVGGGGAYQGGGGADKAALSAAHYGYNGYNVEYGAYVNNRR